MAVAWVSGFGDLCFCALFGLGILCYWLYLCSCACRLVCWGDLCFVLIGGLWFWLI